MKRATCAQNQSEGKGRNLARRLERMSRKSFFTVDTRLHAGVRLLLLFVQKAIVFFFFVVGFVPRRDPTKANGVNPSPFPKGEKKEKNNSVSLTHGR
jgi:hypothetical protein